MRHTKIIATVGPASDSEAALDALVAAGTDIFRLNFSHGTHDQHETTYRRIRAAAARAGREVAVLQDLGGPKIRTGPLAAGRPFPIAPGDRLAIATGDFAGGPGRISTTFAGLARSVRPGDRLLLADGAVELRVDASDGTTIQTTVVDGAEIGERKGINAPGVPLPTSAVTPKDADDLRFGVSLGVDLVALSFVQTPDDVKEARRLLAELGAPETPLVAKLERPQALDCLDAILEACDAVMIARGDLGVELPLERVPRAQKEITRAARRHGMPVIVATQVLESMKTEARPTRAEVNDAANAVDDRVDAIMLSAETSIGVSPSRAVQTLDAIIRDAEAAQPDAPLAPDGPVHRDHAEALCEAAVTLATRGEAEAICAVTRTGNTVQCLSALRPRAPIFAISNRHETARRLGLNWGVVPLCFEFGDNLDGQGMRIGRELVARGLVAAGASVVLVNINPDLSRIDGNYLKIQQL